MKLLIATPLYPPDIGGPATDSSAIASYLKHTGDSCVVVSFGSVRRLPRVIRHIAFMANVLRAGGDVSAIVAFDTVSVAFPSYIAAKILGKPFVVRVPGDYAWEQSTQRFGVTDSIEDFQIKRYGVQVEALRSLQRFVLRRAALVLAPSDFFFGIMNTWGINPKRIRRVYLGLSMEEEKATAPTMEGKVLFSLGRFVPWKGFSMLVDLVSELPEWSLVIAGDGPLHESIANYAKTKGVSDRVYLPGSLPREELIGWFRRADAFVLNTYQENFSFQLLEAMREGSRIITTNIGSLPELVTNDKEGILLNPGDTEGFLAALKTIPTEPEIWEKRRNAAKAKAHMFSIETSASECVKAIRTTCESSS